MIVLLEALIVSGKEKSTQHDEPGKAGLGGSLMRQHQFEALLPASHALAQVKYTLYKIEV